MSIDKKLLVKLKELLDGEMNNIAKEAGVSCSSVYRTLTGKFNSEHILKACLKKAKELKKREESVEKSIEKLLEE